MTRELIAARLREAVPIIAWDIHFLGCGHPTLLDAVAVEVEKMMNEERKDP